MVENTRNCGKCDYQKIRGTADSSPDEKGKYAISLIAEMEEECRKWCVKKMWETCGKCEDKSRCQRLMPSIRRLRRKPTVGSDCAVT